MLFEEEASTHHLNQQAEYVAYEVKGSQYFSSTVNQVNRGAWKEFGQSSDWLTFILETRDTRDATADGVALRSIFIEVVLAWMDLKPVLGLHV